MIKARASGSKVYLYFMKKGRQARHRIPRNSCLVKFIITREFLKIKECYSTLIYVKFCHMSNLPELCIYTKDTTAEMVLKSDQNTHKRNNIGHFRSLMKF